MISYFDCDDLLSEARHKRKPRRTIHISHHESYDADLDKYVGDSDVAAEIRAVVKLFKKKDYSTLEYEYNDHDLKRDDLIGFKGLHLFPGRSKDVVLVYKSHRNGDHIVFHRIGDHDWVYDANYAKMERERRRRN